MKKILLFGFLLCAGLAASGQGTITSYQLLPASASATGSLQLVLNMRLANCHRYPSYQVTQNNNVLYVQCCLSGPAPAIPCNVSDTVQVGQLPSGTYTLAHAFSFGSGPGTCFTANPWPPDTLGTITVSSSLATRPAAPTWQAWPTILPATATSLSLTAASPLRQLAIFDLTGREVAHFGPTKLQVANGPVLLPLPTLPPAVYVLRATDATGRTSVQRLIRQ